MMHDLVSTDPGVMGDMPCFTGTRVPIGNVLGSLDEGMTLAEVRQHYAFVTQAHVDAAMAYVLEHPEVRRARPRK
jgi:uncharacterized protein (DUF433 family)